VTQKPDVDGAAEALLSSVGLLARKVRRLRVEGEPTLPERSALAQLDRCGPATSAELARHEQISPQSMGATLAALEARGLVERRADPGDARRIVLSLTAAGRRVRRDKRNVRIRHLADALSGFTPAEVNRLVAAAPLIERLAQSL
jgi:DNA-binding MarR family transcriptional regulator